VISQVLANGILAGLTWGLAALGFTVVYSTARFLHAAYAATFLAGAYLGISLGRFAGAPAVACFLVAVGGAALLGLGFEAFIYRPLRRRQSPPLIMFFASLAILIIAENSIAVLFGREIQVVPARLDWGQVQVLGAQFTIVQGVAGVAALVVFVATWMFIQLSRTGKQMRALACDPKLAAVVGIDERSTLAVAMLIGSGLSGASGYLLAYDTAVVPAMGFSFLLIAATAAIVGGIGSIAGAMLGGLVVGICQHAGAWLLAPEWQEAIVFVILLAFLVFRPYGFFGRPLRKVTV